MSLAEQSWPVRGVLTVAEAAKYLKVSRPTLYGMMDRGELPWVPVGRRGRRIPVAALEAYVAGRLCGEMPVLPQDVPARHKLRNRLLGVVDGRAD